jgi:pimeloyl-ACP methyl ester carboxylesterase
MLLAYDDKGPGHAVVLLHGFPLNRKMWSAQEASVGSVYRLIVPDLRGHGESAAPEGTYTMDVMADDVIELLDALQITEPIVLGGLSMGGYVALSLASRFPGRIRGLMLMDTRASADSPEVARNRQGLAQRVEESGQVAEVVDAMLPRLFSESTRTTRSDLIAPIRQMMEKSRPRGVAGALRGMAIRPDRTADLAQIQVPTLVLVGADDVITPVEEARAMAKALPKGHLEVIPDAGHLAPWENHAATDRAIVRFLQELP